MKKQAENLVNNLRNFITDLEKKKKSKNRVKVKQLKEVKQAINNLRRDSVTVPVTLIQLEERLIVEIERGAIDINETLEYIKSEITNVIDMNQITGEGLDGSTKVIKPNIIFHEDEVVTVKPSMRVRKR